MRLRSLTICPLQTGDLEKSMVKFRQSKDWRTIGRNGVSLRPRVEDLSLSQAVRQKK